MRQHIFTLIPAMLAAAACGQSGPPPSNQAETQIKVTHPDQKRLHQLGAVDLAIGLKHAIYDAGYTCKRVTDAGFVGTYKNLDMWTAHCVYDKGAMRDWAIFAGPDGSAQVRDCKDIPGTGLPTCTIKQRPEGKFDPSK